MFSQEYSQRLKMLECHFSGRGTVYDRNIPGAGDLQVGTSLEHRVVEFSRLYKVMGPDKSPMGVEFYLKTRQQQFRTVPTDGIRGSNIKTFYGNLVGILGEETILRYDPNESKIKEKTLYDHIIIKGYSKGEEISIYVGKKNGFYYEIEIKVEADKLEEVKAAIKQLLKPKDNEKKLEEA